jgi:hypothetical protein
MNARASPIGDLSNFEYISGFVQYHPAQEKKRSSPGGDALVSDPSQSLSDEGGREYHPRFA